MPEAPRLFERQYGEPAISCDQPVFHSVRRTCEITLSILSFCGINSGGQNGLLRKIPAAACVKPFDAQRVSNPISKKALIAGSGTRSGDRTGFGPEPSALPGADNGDPGPRSPSETARHGGSQDLADSGVPHRRIGGAYSLTKP